MANDPLEVQNQQLSQLAGISGILGKTHCDNAISKFTGETKKFRNWVKSIEKHVKIMAKHEDEAVGGIGVRFYRQIYYCPFAHRMG